MNITPQPNNRVTIACSIPEAQQAYQWIKDNHLMTATVSLDGKELTITAKEKGGK